MMRAVTGGTSGAPATSITGDSVPNAALTATKVFFPHTDPAARCPSEMMTRMERARRAWALGFAARRRRAIRA